MQPSPCQDVQELWFPGVHGDVGGGYPEKDGGLWRVPFDWMLSEATKAGLVVNPDRLHKVLNRTPPSERPWDDPQHESLTPAWWPAEFFPKLSWREGSSWRVPRIGLGRHRFIHDGALIHWSALRRVRESSYAPPNFSPAFLEKIRALAEVPDVLPFAWRREKEKMKLPQSYPLHPA